MLDMPSPGPFACRTPPDVSRPGSWATRKRQLALPAPRESRACVHQLPRAKPAFRRQLLPAQPFLRCWCPDQSFLGQHCLFKMKVLGFFSLLTRFTLSGFTYGKAKHSRVCWGGGPGRSQGTGRAPNPGKACRRPRFLLTWLCECRSLGRGLPPSASPAAAPQ